MWGNKGNEEEGELMNKFIEGQRRTALRDQEGT